MTQMWSRLLLRRSQSPLLSPELRLRVLRRAGIDIDVSRISEEVFFGGTNVRIGARVFVNRGAIFDNMARIEVGNGVSIGHDVLLCTSTHEPGGADKRAGQVLGKPVKIGRGTWVGARAVILPGVTVGEGCVIAAGAVVAEDCQPNGLYAGVPAARIKDLPDDRSSRTG
ncbi:MAG: acyltransferase [Candidatus Nanopelagicales bacterium]